MAPVGLDRRTAGRQVHRQLRNDQTAYRIIERVDGGTWAPRLRGVTAAITHGYPTTPGWLVTLLAAVAGRALPGVLGVAAESSGGESVTYDRVAAGTAGEVLLAPAEERMLDRLALPDRA